MPRLLFQKTGNAVWISHLDLMRLFQRAFKRAGLHLKHTQGFNPRPSVSIALPLSVGVDSYCELLDFDLENEISSYNDMRERLNCVLIDGVEVLDIYENGKKIRELSLLRCDVCLEYNNGIPMHAVENINALFQSESLLVQKKTKNGTQDQDIIPMIRSIAVAQEGNNTIHLNAVVCCQNPTLNPMQLSIAIGIYLPECKPDFSKCSRLEILDKDENVFR